MPSEQALVAVIDTNLIVSAFISGRGAPHQLLTALRAGAFRLVLSKSLRREYADVLARPHLVERYGIDAESVAAFLDLLDRRALLVTPSADLPLAIRDPKDAHVLATALAGGATHLVYGDDDFLALVGDPRLGELHIVAARAFLDTLISPNMPLRSRSHLSRRNSANSAAESKDYWSLNVNLDHNQQQ